VDEVLIISMSPENEGLNREGELSGPLDVTAVYLDSANRQEFLDFLMTQPNEEFRLVLDFVDAFPPTDLNYLATNPSGKKFKITIRASREEYNEHHSQYNPLIEWE
jgi:hypothetical protein